MNTPLDVQAADLLRQLHAALRRPDGAWAPTARQPDLNALLARLIFKLFAGHLNIPADPMAPPECCTETPGFSAQALHIVQKLQTLDWRQVSPAIFGFMLQMGTDEEARAALGMHYTGEVDILRVLDPLLLDGLRVELENADNKSAQLLELRQRLSRIRIFDPACGCGNFLVVAYRTLRALEAEINQRLDEQGRPSDIRLENFRGIELSEFAAGLTRQAMRITERQCDLAHGRHDLDANTFLPTAGTGPSISCGNALRLDWLHICPPAPYSLNGAPGQRGETYICGNPPFTGSRKQTQSQKADLQAVLAPFTSHWKNVDYAGAWLVKAALYHRHEPAPFAFVATNSLCQGQQVPLTWAILKQLGCHIRFAHTSFLWTSTAGHRAGVTVVVVGLDSKPGGERLLYTHGRRRSVGHINPYLAEHRVNIVAPARRPLFVDATMDYGVYYSKSAGLVLSAQEKEHLLREGFPPRLLRRFLGSGEFINGVERYCLWLDDESLAEALEFPAVRERIAAVRRDRLASRDFWVNRLAGRPHQFREYKGDETEKIFIPIVSSVNREYLPVGLADETIVPTSKAFYMPHAPLWCLALLVSRLHLAWISAVCGRLRSDYSYSNTLGWNTFPVPPLTDDDKAGLSRRAQDILAARHAHAPATLAALYDPLNMPAALRHAHERNDEALERLYVGRRFRHDGERLETLFELYSRRMAGPPASFSRARPAE